MPERILITGGAGFLGAHFIEYILQNTDWNIVCVDRFTQDSGALTRLKEIGAYNHVRVFFCPINLPGSPQDFERLRGAVQTPDYIVHLAGENSIDASIRDPRSCVFGNVMGTLAMLEYARTVPNLKRFVYFSSDEVFGPPLDVSFEWDNYNSQNPYAASKAAGEEMCLAWANTYGVPALVTHSQNLIGERQQLEKFLPTIVHAGLKKKTVKVYVDPGTGKAGRRNYLHAKEAVSAVMFLLEKGAFREKYNITGGEEISNFDLLIKVSEIMKIGIPWETIPAPEARPGFSVRYGLNGDELAHMGWKPAKSFEQNLTETIQWMMNGDNWGWMGMR